MMRELALDELYEKFQLGQNILVIDLKLLGRLQSMVLGTLLLHPFWERSESV